MIFSYGLASFSARLHCHVFSRHLKGQGYEIEFQYSDQKFTVIEINKDLSCFMFQNAPLVRHYLPFLALQYSDQKFTVIEINKDLSWFMYFQNAYYLPFLARFRWKRIGGLTYIGDISSLLSIGSLSTRFLLVHCSSSNIFFKIATKLFKGRREEYGLLVHRNLLVCTWDHFKIVLESINCNFEDISCTVLFFLPYVFTRISWNLKDWSTEVHSKVKRSVEVPVDLEGFIFATQSL